MIEIKLLTDNAQLPSYGSSGAAGMDLYAAESCTLHPDKPESVSTGIAVKIPKGFAGIVHPRSGLAFKQGIDTLAGVIDSDYRGEVKVLLCTHGKQPVTLNAGDRIAQLLITPTLRLTPTAVDELDDTERGNSGFGSTGQ